MSKETAGNSSGDLTVGIAAVAEYASNVVASVNAYPLFADVIKASVMQRLGQTYLPPLNSNSTSYDCIAGIEAREGQLTEIWGLDVPIGSGYFPVTKRASINRPATLLVGPDKRLHELDDPTRPLRLSLDAYNSSKELDRVWRELGSHGEIETIYWLNPHDVKKQATLSLPSDLSVDTLPFSFTQRHMNNGSGRQLIVVELPMLIPDVTMAGFALNAIAECLKSAGVPV